MTKSSLWWKKVSFEEAAINAGVEQLKILEGVWKEEKNC
jgi:hypothetical protein